MQLQPPVRDFLMAPLEVSGVGEPVAMRREVARAGSDTLFRMFAEPAPRAPEASEHQVEGEAGVRRVRVYRPPGLDTEGLPIHVFFHGGGFWLGSVDEDAVDATCRERSLGAQCVVVSVDYRLAPEHPFPSAVHDGLAALTWALRQAEQWGGDPGNVSVGGISAGGNLAAAVALLARDHGLPPLRLQLLEVPFLDLTLDTMRGSRVGDDYGLTLADMESAVGMYLPTPELARDPLASPLLRPDLRGLAPARILTAEFDPLADDGERYTQRLNDAGVPVVHTRQPGGVHTSLILTRTWAPARTWRADVIAALRRAHQPAGDTAAKSAHRPAEVLHREVPSEEATA